MGGVGLVTAMAFSRSMFEVEGEGGCDCEAGSTLSSGVRCGEVSLVLVAGVEKDWLVSLGVRWRSCLGSASREALMCRSIGGVRPRTSRRLLRHMKK